VISGKNRPVKQKLKVVVIVVAWRSPKKTLGISGAELVLQTLSPDAFY